MKILHYCGGLNFASRQHFRKTVYKIAGIVPQKELTLRLKMSERSCTESTNKVCNNFVWDIFFQNEKKII